MLFKSCSCSISCIVTRFWLKGLFPPWLPEGIATLGCIFSCLCGDIYGEEWMASLVLCGDICGEGRFASLDLGGDKGSKLGGVAGETGLKFGYLRGETCPVWDGLGGGTWSKLVGLVGEP